MSPVNYSLRVYTRQLAAGFVIIVSYTSGWLLQTIVISTVKRHTSSVIASPDRSGLAMTWKRELVIEFRHCEERSDAAIHAASAKPVKMDRHAPTSRDSR